MGTKEKLRERFMKQPSDFTFEEMQHLLEGYGYKKSNKGRTSGSRIIFKNGEKASHHVAQTSSWQHRERICHEASAGRIKRSWFNKKIGGTQYEHNDV